MADDDDDLLVEPRTEALVGCALVAVSLARGWLEGPAQMDLLAVIGHIKRRRISGVERDDAISWGMSLMEQMGELPDETDGLERLMGLAYDELAGMGVWR